ncbi:MAG: hypothetical protein ACLTS6_04185 [Anaerobutyricum sp.]
MPKECLNIKIMLIILEVIIMRKGISAEVREDILVQAFLTCPNISGDI